MTNPLEEHEKQFLKDLKLNIITPEKAVEQVNRIIAAIDKALASEDPPKHHIIIDSYPSGLTDTVPVIYIHQRIAAGILSSTGRTILDEMPMPQPVPRQIGITGLRGINSDLHISMLDPFRRDMRMMYALGTGKSSFLELYGSRHFCADCAERVFFNKEEKVLPYFADRKEYWLRQGKENDTGHPKKHRAKTKRSKASRKLNRKINR
jgi:hypothetical protein